MIDKDKIIDTVIERLSKLPVGYYMDLRTYKRNRSVIVVKKSDNELLVIEKGFYRERFEVNLEKLKKLLKTLLKKEFPRSSKVRLYVMGEYNENEAEGVKRKKI